MWLLLFYPGRYNRFLNEAVKLLMFIGLVILEGISGEARQWLATKKYDSLFGVQFYVLLHQNTIVVLQLDLVGFLQMQLQRLSSCQ